jgi:hypothetical protein
MPSEYISELRKWAAGAAHNSSPDEALNWTRAVELVGKNFGVQIDEVAILALATDGRFLRFIVPERLREVGRIPLTSTSSLAARTAREKRSEFINHFAVVPHASVFEAVPVSEEQPGEAIQKIMSAPMMVERRVVGVIQISRKGGRAAEAGPDFTPQQLRELRAIADALAPSVSLLIQE